MFFSSPPLNFYKASRFVHQWNGGMDAPDRHSGLTDQQTNVALCPFVSLIPW